MPAVALRGINLKLPAGAFREAIKRESPRRKRGDQQDADPTGPVQAVRYGDDDYAAALGERPILVTPDGAARILPPGATPTEHPDTMGAVAEWDRAGILARFVGRQGWATAVKPSNTEAAEWDHLALTMSRQAGEEATPEQLRAALAILVDVLRTPPLRFTRDGDPETFQRWQAEKRITRGDVLGLDGARMIHVLPVHDDTDNVHVQLFVHRHPVDIDAREVGAAIKQHELIVTRAQVAALNALFEANGLPFVVSNGFERINAGQGASLDPDQAAEVVQAIEAAGGTAPARLTAGMQGQLAGVVAVPSVQPDAQRIAASIDEDAQQLARMKSEIDKLAARIADKQHAVAAIQRAAEADARAEAEARARADAEARATAAEAAAEERASLIASLRGEVDQLTAERDTASQLAAERSVDLDDVREQLRQAEQHAEAEPDRTAAAVAEAVQPIAAERDALAARAEAAEARAAAAEAELAEERRTFVDRARAWAEENLVSPLRRELEETRATVARQAQEIAAFPARMAEAIRDAEARMEARIGEMVRAAVEATRAAMAAPFQAAGEAIRPKTQAEQDARAEAEWQAVIREGKPWDALSRSAQRIALARYSEEVRLALAGDDANARIPESARELYETAAGMAHEARQEAAGQPQAARGRATTPQAPEAPQAAPKGRRAGADFLSVPPLEWTPAQRAAAAEALEKKRASDPDKWAGYSVERYGEEGHAAWQRRQAPKPKM